MAVYNWLTIRPVVHMAMTLKTITVIICVKKIVSMIQQNPKKNLSKIQKIDKIRYHSCKNRC